MESMDAMSGVTSSMSFSRENCLKEEVLVILAMTTKLDERRPFQNRQPKGRFPVKPGERGRSVGLACKFATIGNLGARILSGKLNFVVSMLLNFRLPPLFSF